jgi:quinol monooxygenase YgiN
VESPTGDLMIVNTSRITLRPDKRQEFFQTIGRLLDPIKKTPGCLTFRCYVDSNDENSSLLIGEWETESDLNSYLHSDDFAILKGAIKILSIQSTDCQALITQVFGRHTAANAPSEIGTARDQQQRFG